MVQEDKGCWKGEWHGWVRFERNTEKTMETALQALKDLQKLRISKIFKQQFQSPFRWKENFINFVHHLNNLLEEPINPINPKPGIFTRKIMCFFWYNFRYWFSDCVSNLILKEHKIPVYIWSTLSEKKSLLSRHTGCFLKNRKWINKLKWKVSNNLQNIHYAFWQMFGNNEGQQ